MSAAHGGPPELVLGPLLRYVDETRATVWVETDRPCEVVVDVGGGEDASSGRAPTFGVHGHHYALVVVRGLPSGAVLPYRVSLDGHVVWPAEDGPGGPGSPFPPSTVRTRGETGRHGAGHLRLSFGSCRRAGGDSAPELRALGADALAALALRMAATAEDSWPHVLLLVGDQVYADMPSEPLRRRLREAHRDSLDADPDVRDEIGTFEEYTWLYRETWGTPEVRWLLSTVPSCMLLDDHDLRDDWNTSRTWRERVSAQPWWRDRVVGAFASYWVHQHLGNLSPDDIGRDPVWRALHAERDDAGRSRVLDDFAWRADAEPTSARWSFRRDLGDVRLVAVDSRCSRVLDPRARRMVDRTEWAWVREQVLDADGRAPRHVLLATTLPVFLPRALHDLEGWDEAVAEGAWGRRWARAGERLRQAADLEHWAAFRASFAEFTDLLAELCSPARAGAPRSVLVLSGDVHCSYSAEVRLPGVDPARTAVHQLVMSPFRNPMERLLRAAIVGFETRPLRSVLARLARSAGVAADGVSWRVTHGPWFANGVTTLDVAGERATAEVDHALVVGGRQLLERTADVPVQG
ncbi:PhoD-like phosphatase [Kineococcus xinjiangensis]|uniref:PhoD-like phosphatase n=1 Tax=Kineococcus xinjiangensis TaxID=512762 RepID=A0A2S6IX27_9ACTN|nr:alkaline phosphatase D family protein [Kineococcus xinjiangensis]PPK98711.1 PhoD-like phosphatase [Kineococcus xinjiangensis]